MSMGMKIEMQNIPHDLMGSISQDLAQYTIGFLCIKETPNKQDAILLGSGTLVKINDCHAILTVHHVLDVLPTEGRLGLILTAKAHQTTVDVSGINYLKIARGKIDSQGPDLAAVILSPAIASSITAIKSFYNLSLHREHMLNDPPGINDGIWFDKGFVDEKTVVEDGRNGFSEIKRFHLMGGAGGPDEQPRLDGDYDYYSLPITYNANSEAPICFGGMSGGGLWQVPLISGQNGEISAKKPMLSGVVFFQEPTVKNKGSITCHGRSSVYKVTYDAINKL